MKSSKRIIRHRSGATRGKSAAPVKLKIKKGDTVLVVSGKDKGKQGTVLRVLRNEARVIVEGIAKVKRHLSVKRGGIGGIVERESSIHVSNVMLFDPEKKVGTRVGRRSEEKGVVRYAKKSGKTLK